MQRIRSRLIIAFLCVTLLPAVPLSLVVRNLIDRSFSPALDPSLEEAIEAGLAVSRDRLQEKKSEFALELQTAPSEGAGEAVSWLGNRDTAAETEIIRWAAQRDGAPTDPARVGNALAAIIVLPDGRHLTAARLLPPEMVARAHRMTTGLSLLRVLREDRSAVLRSYVIPFMLVYGVLIVVAVAAGALVSRRLARPIEALAAGTRKVAAGDLDARVGGRWSGEMGELVRAFDRMVERLSKQRRELARLERVAAWRDLARTLAHEIKNPLTPILLAVQQARDSYPGGDEQYSEMLDECTDIVREEVDGLRGLVAEFSEFARLPRPQPQSGDLRPLLADLVRLYGEDRLGCEVESEQLAADIDTKQLRRAMINLVDNALTASADSPVIPPVTLTCHSRAGGGWKLCVRDRGRGIPAENLERVFEPNFSTRKEGMGLGLPIVESIVMGHGGRISVESEVGRGTEFRIDLPRPAPEEGQR